MKTSCIRLVSSAALVAVLLTFSSSALFLVAAVPQTINVDTACPASGNNHVVVQNQMHVDGTIVSGTFPAGCRLSLINVQTRFLDFNNVLSNVPSIDIVHLTCLSPGPTFGHSCVRFKETVANCNINISGLVYSHITVAAVESSPQSSLVLFCAVNFEKNVAASKIAVKDAVLEKNSLSILSDGSAPTAVLLRAHIVHFSAGVGGPLFSLSNATMRDNVLAVPAQNESNINNNNTEVILAAVHFSSNSSTSHFDNNIVDRVNLQQLESSLCGVYACSVLRVRQFFVSSSANKRANWTFTGCDVESPASLIVAGNTTPNSTVSGDGGGGVRFLFADNFVAAPSLSPSASVSGPQKQFPHILTSLPAGSALFDLGRGAFVTFICNRWAFFVQREFELQFKRTSAVAASQQLNVTACKSNFVTRFVRLSAHNTAGGAADQQPSSSRRPRNVSWSFTLKLTVPPETVLSIDEEGEEDAASTPSKTRHLLPASQPRDFPSVKLLRVLDPALNDYSMQLRYHLGLDNTSSSSSSSSNTGVFPIEHLATSDAAGGQKVSSSSSSLSSLNYSFVFSFTTSTQSDGTLRPPTMLNVPFSEQQIASWLRDVSVSFSYRCKRDSSAPRESCTAPGISFARIDMAFDSAEFFLAPLFAAVTGSVAQSATTCSSGSSSGGGETGFLATFYNSWELSSVFDSVVSPNYGYWIGARRSSAALGSPAKFCYTRGFELQQSSSSSTNDLCTGQSCTDGWSGVAFGTSFFSTVFCSGACASASSYSVPLPPSITSQNSAFCAAFNKSSPFVGDRSTASNYDDMLYVMNRTIFAASSSTAYHYAVCQRALAVRSLFSSGSFVLLRTPYVTRSRSNSILPPSGYMWSVVAPTFSNTSYVPRSTFIVQRHGAPFAAYQPAGMNVVVLARGRDCDAASYVSAPVDLQPTNGTATLTATEWSEMMPSSSASEHHRALYVCEYQQQQQQSPSAPLLTVRFFKPYFFMPAVIPQAINNTTAGDSSYYLYGPVYPGVPYEAQLQLNSDGTIPHGTTVTLRTEQSVSCDEATSNFIRYQSGNLQPGLFWLPPLGSNSSYSVCAHVYDSVAAVSRHFALGVIQVMAATTTTTTTTTTSTTTEIATISPTTSSTTTTTASADADSTTTTSASSTTATPDSTTTTEESTERLSTSVVSPPTSATTTTTTKATTSLLATTTIVPITTATTTTTTPILSSTPQPSRNITTMPRPPGRMSKTRSHELSETLDAPPTPSHTIPLRRPIPVPVHSQSLNDAAFGIATATGAAAANAVVVQQLQRSLALLTIVRCGADAAEPLPLSHHPTQVTIGRDWLEHHRGTVVMNTVLAAAFLALYSLAVPLLMLAKGWRCNNNTPNKYNNKSNNKHEQEEKEAKQTPFLTYSVNLLRWPCYCFTAFALIAAPAARSATVLLLFGNGVNDVMLMVFIGLFLPFAPAAVLLALDLHSRQFVAFKLRKVALKSRRSERAERWERTQRLLLLAAAEQKKRRSGIQKEQQQQQQKDECELMELQVLSPHGAAGDAKDPAAEILAAAAAALNAAANGEGNSHRVVTGHLSSPTAEEASAPPPSSSLPHLSPALLQLKQDEMEKKRKEEQQRRQQQQRRQHQVDVRNGNDDEEDGAERDEGKMLRCWRTVLRWWWYLVRPCLRYDERHPLIKQWQPIFEPLRVLWFSWFDWCVTIVISVIAGIASSPYHVGSTQSVRYCIAGCAVSLAVLVLHGLVLVFARPLLSRLTAVLQILLTTLAVIQAALALTILINKEAQGNNNDDDINNNNNSNGLDAETQMSRINTATSALGIVAGVVAAFDILVELYLFIVAARNEHCRQKKKEQDAEAAGVLEHALMTGLLPPRRATPIDSQHNRDEEDDDDESESAENDERSAPLLAVVPSLDGKKKSEEEQNHLKQKKSASLGLVRAAAIVKMSADHQRSKSAVEQQQKQGDNPLLQTSSASHTNNKSASFFAAPFSRSSYSSFSVDPSAPSAMQQHAQQHPHTEASKALHQARNIVQLRALARSIAALSASQSNSNLSLARGYDNSINNNSTVSVHSFTAAPSAAAAAGAGAAALDGSISQFVSPIRSMSSVPSFAVEPSQSGFANNTKTTFDDLLRQLADDEELQHLADLRKIDSSAQMLRDLEQLRATGGTETDEQFWARINNGNNNDDDHGDDAAAPNLLLIPDDDADINTEEDFDDLLKGKSEASFVAPGIKTHRVPSAPRKKSSVRREDLADLLENAASHKK